MKRLICIFIILTGFSSYSQGDSLFDQGNAAYREGKYEKAVATYQKVLENGHTSVSLHYNLGNAYYKLEKIAPSIFHYEKALQLAPGDEDVKNNLEFARNMTVDGLEEPKATGFIFVVDAAISFLSPTGWAWTAIVFMFFFTCLILLYYFNKRAALKRLFFTSGILILVLSSLSAGAGFMRQYCQETRSFAIVFSEEVQVKSEPDIRSKDIFVLHEGTKVKINEQFQNWYEIEVGNGSQGWIRDNEVKNL